MPLRRPRWFAGFMPTARQAALWFFSILVVAVISAWAASYFTRQDNLELAFKQQQLSDVQLFQASGSKLDESFRAFNDALVDQRGVGTAREAMRAAIAQHSSETYGLQRVFGNEAMAYIDGLARLGNELDKADKPANAMQMAQTAIDLLEERDAMVKRAEAKIGT